MKKLSLVLGLGILAAGSSWADCPNLAGEYQCIEDLSTYVAKIEQRQIEGGTAYKFILPDESGQGESVWDVLADGKEHDFLAQGVTDGKYTAVCVDQKNMKVDFSGKLTDMVADFKMSMLHNRENQDLVVRTTGIVIAPDHTQTIDDTMTCTLK